LIRRSAAPRRGVTIPSGAGASGSNDLPWALPRVLQAIPKIKRAAGANGPRAGRDPGGVCSKDVSSGLVRDGRGSAIAARSAGRRRGPGRGGRPRRAIGPRRRANRSVTGRAGVTGSASGAENHQQARPFRRPRGSSLRSFFDAGCDRPGCYAGFVRQRRSPWQHFCSHECRRAMERVWERERYWQRTRAG
jgi:hypothetical protein